jgi:hypothetical protein
VIRWLAAALLVTATVALAQGDDTSYLTWSAKDAEVVGKAMYHTGRVGRFLDLRVLKTDRAYNYKLAATWLTPEVIKATARLQQLARRLSEAETRQLVSATSSADETTVMVEIDPREGSGVIPLDWVALLEPRLDDKQALPAIAGAFKPDHRADPMFAGVLRRNYDYDRFWVSFPLKKDGKPTIPAEAVAVDLVVRIYDKEGRVSWPLTPALKAWLAGRQAAPAH